jgi:hypothetical protein
VEIENILSLFYLLLVPYLIQRQKHRLMGQLCVWSLMVDFIKIHLSGPVSTSPTIFLHQWVALCNIPNIILVYKMDQRTFLMRSFKPITVEFGYITLLACIFGFLYPWHNPNIHWSWNIAAPGRSIIALISYLSSLSLAVYIALLFRKRILTTEILVKTLIYACIFNLVTAVILHYISFDVRNVIFHEQSLHDRFVGFNFEPRYFGKNSSIALQVFLVCFFTAKINRLRLLLGIFLSLICIYLCASASAYSSTIAASTAALIFIDRHPIYILKKKNYILWIFIGVSLVCFITFYSNSTDFIRRVSYKVEKVVHGAEDDRIPDEPFIFTRLEVFDRAAMNYLYHNPVFIFFGVGPNLIHLPSAEYVSPRDRRVFKNIGTPPGTMIVRFLSNGGLISITCWTFFFWLILKHSMKLKNSHVFALTIANIVINSLTLSLFLFFLTGYAIGLLALQKDLLKTGFKCSV